MDLNQSTNSDMEMKREDEEDDLDAADESMRFTKVRRRDRKTISCTTCRKRKVKCDRGRPICGACKKNNVPVHLCVYDDNPWISALVKEQSLKSEMADLEKENDRINMLIKRKREQIATLILAYGDGKTVGGAVEGGLRGGVGDHEQALADEADQMVLSFDETRLDVKAMAVVNHNASKTAWRTFGALSWQALFLKKGTKLSRLVHLYSPIYETFSKNYNDQIVAKEAFTGELFNLKKVYNTVNIEKRYSNIIIDPTIHDKDDVFGKKLQELAKSLPSHKVVETKFNYFFEMKYAAIIDTFFAAEVIKADFKRIVRKTSKGNVEFYLYTETEDYYTEAMKLAGILLFIKFGIMFSQDDDDELKYDRQNLLPRYAISCLYVGKGFIKPSMITLMVIIFLETLKYLNLDDSGEEAFLRTTRMDAPIALKLAFDIALALGLANDFKSVPKFDTDPVPMGDSYVTKEELQGLWVNLLTLDYKLSMRCGCPLVIPTFLGYDKTSLDRKLNHIGMMRKMCDKYSIFTNCLHHTAKSRQIFEQKNFVKRVDLKNDLLELTEYFKDNVRAEPKFWANFPMRTMDTAPEKDTRVLHTLEVLDLTLSLSFLLFASYDSQEDQMNLDVPDSLSEVEKMKLKNLADQYMNNALLHAVYIFKISEWFFSQSVSNEAVNKDRLLEVTSFPILKKTLNKATIVCASILLTKSTMDEFGVVFDYNTRDLSCKFGEQRNLFHYKLQELDEICFQTNVNNRERLQFLTRSLSNDYLQQLKTVSNYLKQIPTAKKDFKWFISYREIYFTLYYMFQLKRRKSAHGEPEDATKNVALEDVFIPDEYVRFKREEDQYLDADYGNRYALRYILN